ncbi:MAG: thiopurine S-methyltransferase [Pseudomonadota bacterium]|nr:thiopurine S-methyltransferase [Pseudomonadota bacterium]
MQPEFWNERWRLGQIGFHQSAVDPHLARYWPQLEVAVEGSVFVPLCGKTLDLLWLSDRGHPVTGVELSPIAVEAFCMEHGIPARRRKLEFFDLYQATKLRLYCGDFFALTPPLLTPLAAVYDRAALISWAPELRAAYVAHLTSLTHVGTRMLLITLEYPPGQMTGPPFCVRADEVRRLYERHFAIEELERVDTLATDDRMRARGVTELHEVCYALRRL